MTLIKCPHCNQDISDQAIECPKCKRELSHVASSSQDITAKIHVCKDCGISFNPDEQPSCPNCGCPYPVTPEADSQQSKESLDPDLKKAFIRVGIFVLVLVLAIAIIAIVSSNSESPSPSSSSSTSSSVSVTVGDALKKARSALDSYVKKKGYADHVSGLSHTYDGGLDSSGTGTVIFYIGGFLDDKYGNLISGKYCEFDADVELRYINGVCVGAKVTSFSQHS